MATLYVNTDDQSGGEYASLALAEAALPATLTEPYVIECSGATADTSLSTFDGYAATSVNDLVVTVALAWQHGGAWDETKYRIEYHGSAAPITVLSPYTTIDSLQAKNTEQTKCFGVSTTVAGVVKLTNNIACFAGGGGNGFNTAALFASGFELHLYSNIADGAFMRSYDLRSTSNTAWELYAFNNIGYGATSRGFNHERCTGITQVRNNIMIPSLGNAYQFGNVSSTRTDSNNISSDATAPGANSLTNQLATDIFTDPANGDFTLKPGSPAIGAGADLSADFTTDITGATRTTPWDIGAFMYAVGGGGGTPITNYFDLRSAISTAVAEYLDTQASISTTITGTADLKTGARNSLSASSDSRASISTAIITPADLRAAISNELASLFDARVSISEQQQISISFDTLTAISNQTSMTADLRASIANDLSQIYDTRAHILNESSVVVSFDTLASITNSLINATDLRSAISNELITAADARAAVSTLVSDQADTRTGISNQVSFSADTAVIISGLLTIVETFDTRVSVSNELTGNFDTRVFVLVDGDGIIVLKVAFTAHQPDIKFTAHQGNIIFTRIGD